MVYFEGLRLSRRCRSLTRRLKNTRPGSSIGSEKSPNLSSETSPAKIRAGLATNQIYQVINSTYLHFVIIDFHGTLIGKDIVFFPTAGSRILEGIFELTLRPFKALPRLVRCFWNWRLPWVMFRPRFRGPRILSRITDANINFVFVVYRHFFQRWTLVKSRQNTIDSVTRPGYRQPERIFVRGGPGRTEEYEHRKGRAGAPSASGRPSKTTTWLKGIESPKF